MFPTNENKESGNSRYVQRGRNPLKSGQCFLHKNAAIEKRTVLSGHVVAIPSNRVNVSYIEVCYFRAEDGLYVAIPSNRVNVSYRKEV